MLDTREPAESAAQYLIAHHEATPQNWHARRLAGWLLQACDEIDSQRGRCTAVCRPDVCGRGEQCAEEER